MYAAILNWKINFFSLFFVSLVFPVTEKERKTDGYRVLGAEYTLESK
jgi:hypothetical protein